MSLTKKILPYVLTAGIALSGSSALAGNRDCPTDFEAARKLRVSKRFISYLPDCYKTDKITKARLMALSEYISGNAKIEYYKGSYVIKYNHNEINKNILKEIIKIIDLDKNKIITPEEVRIAEKAMYSPRIFNKK